MIIQQLQKHKQQFLFCLDKKSQNVRASLDGSAYMTFQHCRGIWINVGYFTLRVEQHQGKKGTEFCCHLVVDINLLVERCRFPSLVLHILVFPCSCTRQTFQLLYMLENNLKINTWKKHTLLFTYRSKGVCLLVVKILYIMYDEPLPFNNFIQMRHNAK